jgi:hypothetical protein
VGLFSDILEAQAKFRRKKQTAKAFAAIKK